MAARPMAQQQAHFYTMTKNERQVSRKPGRIWLRATDAEWSAIKAAAESEHLTRSQWIISTLVDEAAREKGMGIFKTRDSHQKHRRVPGETLSDEDTNPKRNIYCDPSEAELIKGVALGRGLSLNAWAMRVLNFKADKFLNTVINTHATQLTESEMADLKKGKIPRRFRKS